MLECFRSCNIGEKLAFNLGLLPSSSPQIPTPPRHDPQPSHHQQERKPKRIAGALGIPFQDRLGGIVRIHVADLFRPGRKALYQLGRRNAAVTP